MLLRRLMLVAACSAVLGLGASWLAAAYVSRSLAALPRAGAEESAPVNAIPSNAEALETASCADSPPSRDRRHSSKAPARTLADDLKGGIRKLGDRRYEITRGAVDLALRNAHVLSRWIRAVPEVRDGRAAGFLLAFVSANGPFGKLGLRGGDVLVSVNGFDIRTPDRALDAYANLKSASRFAVTIVRDSRETPFEYRIR